MKRIIKQTAFCGALLAAFFFAGCEKQNSNGVFGFAYIYMPQSLQSGGVSLNYLVPSGSPNSATDDYTIDSANNRLNVILGVSRSGMQPAEAYSVQVATDPDTINAAIAGGVLNVGPDQGDPVVLLPDKAYTLPATVNVPAGQYAATFDLSIDISQLKGYAGEKVAVAVYITNPSKYKLNSTQSETIVIIDVDALHL